MGRLCTGVRSTGVYCRPSCPSRRPRAQPDSFSSSSNPKPLSRKDSAPAGAAVRGGHRQIRKQALSGACAAKSEASPEGGVSLPETCRSDGLSAPRTCNARFAGRWVSRRGNTPMRSARRAAQIRIAKGEGRDHSYAFRFLRLHKPGLYEKSDAQLGMTPATYRKGRQGMNISYTVAPCALGRVLVAATERGISAVYMGGRGADLWSASLRKEYPNAEIERAISEKHSRGGFRPSCAIWRGTNPNLDLPTDVAATGVSSGASAGGIAHHSPGTTRTYSEVARSIGQPSATRAVARACATNPASIVVPCHRVVRRDGALGGYRWGLDRKKSLLERERRSAKAASRLNSRFRTTSRFMGSFRSYKIPQSSEGQASTRS